MWSTTHLKSQTLPHPHQPVNLDAPKDSEHPLTPFPSPPANKMPLVLEFLTQVRNLVRAQDGGKLRAWLQVEPGSPQQYHRLAAELRSQFRQQGLDNVIERSLPQDDDVPDGQATVWPGFIAFMKDYLAFWRDVDYDDLLNAHQLLSGLVKCVYPNPH